MAPVLFSSMRRICPIVLVCIALLARTGWAEELVPVRILTEPPGAEVYLDGVPRGETPATLHVPAGRHSLFLFLRGMLPIERVVTWAPGERPILRETLRRQSGGIVVLSDPPGAEVFLDGRRLGAAPFAFEKLPSGVHELKITKPGFDPLITRVHLDSDEPNVVAVRLHGPPVFLWVEGPPGSQVYLDGSYAGEVTAEALGIKIRPGRHELRIERHGFASVQTLQIEPGQDAFAFAGEMKRIPGVVVTQPPRLNPRWFGVAFGATAVVAGGAVAISSAMQAAAARQDYEQAWRVADIAAARKRVENANRRVIWASGSAVVGGLAGMWFWPSEAPTVTILPPTVLLAWRLP